jgi:hypothetical protein
MLCAEVRRKSRRFLRISTVARVHTREVPRLILGSPFSPSNERCELNHCDRENPHTLSAVGLEITYWSREMIFALIRAQGARWGPSGRPVYPPCTSLMLFQDRHAAADHSNRTDRRTVHFPPLRHPTIRCLWDASFANRARAK